MSLTLLFSGSACLALETVHLLLLAAHVQADILQWPDHQQEELQEGCPVCRGGHQPQCLEVLPLRHAGGLSGGHRDQCSLDNAFISLECLRKIEDWQWQSQSLWLWCVILPNILPNQHFENFWEFPFWIMILNLKQTFLTGSFSQWQSATTFLSPEQERQHGGLTILYYHNTYQDKLKNSGYTNEDCFIITFLLLT